ncbi:MAG: flippase [Sedimentisphaerales bacterium]|nr:flippase [Sedimentisphaerales bacterium]
MNTIQRVVKNAGLLFAASIISKVLSFLQFMYIVRYLGAEGFGTLSFALAFTGIFGIFSDLGLGQIIVRELARDKSLASNYVGNIITLKIVLVAITFSLIVLAVNILGYPAESIKIVYLISFFVLIKAFTGVFNATFQAYEKMEYVSLGRILDSVLLLSGSLIVIWGELGIVWLAVIYCIDSVFVLIFSFAICVWKFVKPTLRADIVFWKNVIKDALPFAISGIFVMIYYWIDSVMLSFMKGNATVGWYNAAYRLIVMLVFIPTIINIAVFPTMSNFYLSSQNRLKLIVEKYFKLMLILGIPIGIGTVLLADKIILLIFDETYTQSIISLQILIWAAVFIFANAAFVRLFGAINRQVILAKITGFAVIENVILNVMVIPKFSYIGASVTTLITECTIATLAIIYGFKLGYGFPLKHFLQYITKPLIAGAAMGIMIWELSDLSLALIVPLAVLVYMVVLFMVGGIGRDEMELVKRVRGSTGGEV